MIHRLTFSVILLSALVVTASRASAGLIDGTIFLDSDIITSSDASAFTGVTYVGQGNRLMFDRRLNAFVTFNAYNFNATYSDGLSIEIQVNPEFGSESALLQAELYGNEIGRLPKALRMDVQTSWIHQGVQPFGGGNNNILIHTGQADVYAAAGILEETLVHEAAHTSLDAAHAASDGWRAAQLADGAYISGYAEDNPEREDIAESFLPYLAIRYRLERISPEMANAINATIPNRIAYFDAQNFDMFPVAANPVPEPSSLVLFGMGVTGLCGYRWRRKRHEAA